MNSFTMPSLYAPFNNPTWPNDLWTYDSSEVQNEFPSFIESISSELDNSCEPSEVSHTMAPSSMSISSSYSSHDTSSSSSSPILFSAFEPVPLLETPSQTDQEAPLLALLKQPNRSSRNDNYCETVSVESTAHVAQIVGKNGCKIKHLRAKFGTYIHTPSSTDEPVFIIKGQRQKVMEVKQEIIKAAKHFTNIKNMRNMKIANIINSDDSIRLRLFMPNKYIGLVVGRNGWFVKELQLKFHIYIETPKYELCNYFQLYGTRETLYHIKNLVHEHIYKKTGIKLVERDEGFDVYFEEE